MSQEPEELAAEVERLRAERDALEAELETKRPQARWRSVVTIVLVVLAVLSLAVATPAAWGRRTLTDTDRYVATVAPLASDPAIQEALAREITLAVFDALAVEDRIAALIDDLAPRLVFISGPITQGLEGFVQDQVQKIVESDLFQEYWVKANRFVHEQAMAALRGEGDTISTADGAVTLHYLPLVNETMKSLGGLVSDLIGKPVTLPEITPDTVPSEAITKIEEVTGIDLPATFGSVVIYESDAFASAQRAFEVANRAVFLLIFLFLAFTAGALWLSQRRRRTLLQLMAAFAVVLVVERRGAMAAASSIVDDANPENQAAVQAVLDTVLGSLLRYTGWLLAAALVTALIALVTGPYAWAVRLRTAIADLWRGITGMEGAGDEGTTVAWIAAHRDPMMLAGAALAVVVVWLADLSPFGLLLIALALGVYELFVWRAGAARSTEAPTPGG